jgi:N-carbamoylputrescine amidase
MREVVLAAVQMQMPQWDREANVVRAIAHVRAAAERGAQIIVLPELFELPYFCTEQDSAHFAHARAFAGNETIERFSHLAAELQVVLPISFFELAGQVFYNTVAMIDADGTVLGCYRKTHIPDGPGYNEKYYFTPGDTGYKVWQTRYARVGLGICWDQWFPECARAMALMGAEVLLYPTAIGSEPQDASIDSAAHWQTVMRGHAGANLMPVLAANRIGTEQGRAFAQTYYGSSFIAGPWGELQQAANRTEETEILARFELDSIAQRRAFWGLFRDRRPQTYGVLATSDGVQHATNV